MANTDPQMAARYEQMRGDPNFYSAPVEPDTVSTPEGDQPFLTPEKAFGLAIVILGLIALFAGTLGSQGFFVALIVTGTALIALGSGFLGFSSMRSSTGGR